MNSNRVIGGYFGLEIEQKQQNLVSNLIAVNSGRSGLELILLQRKYKKVYIPYYTCDAVLEPLIRLGIDYTFYTMSEYLVPQIPKMSEDEAVIVNNYFGICDNMVQSLASNHVNLIIDNSQAFYAAPIGEIPTFYSPRKFFGVPDGGFVSMKVINPITLEKSSSYDHFNHLLIRMDESPEAGYAVFKENEKKLSEKRLQRMSVSTEKILSGIDFNRVKKKRLDNFFYLHSKLSKYNEFEYIIEQNTFSCPMVYPLLLRSKINMHERLSEEKIFCARYWQNIVDWVEDNNSIEGYLYKFLIPLPIDQRYSVKDMIIIIDVLRKIGFE